VTAKNRRTRGYVGGITLTDIETVMDENWMMTGAVGMTWTYRDRSSDRRFEVTVNSGDYVETVYYRGKFSTELQEPLNDIIRNILRRSI
jgi:hypothetical protein